MAIADLITKTFVGRIMRRTNINPETALAAGSRSQVARVPQQTDAVQFGPGTPPQPMPLDDTGQPRGWAYPPGWNLFQAPAVYKPVTFETLRQLADVYDILRMCIELRKDEVASLDWDIVVRESDARLHPEKKEEYEARIQEIKAFFIKPDGKRTFEAWLRALLEDYFVVDAMTVWKWRKLNGSLYRLRILDGTTIKPLIDANGDFPDPPLPAYQQYIHGAPRYEFTYDELMYRPKNTRTYTPYGFSPVEQIITHINTGLRYQLWTAAYFTDGTLPEGVLEGPQGWTATQIKEFNAYWDAILAGDPKALRKLKMVPPGSKPHVLKSFSFETQFAMYLLEVTCAALGVNPAELGFMPKSGGLGGKGWAESQHKVQRRKATWPLCNWLADEIFNPIIADDFQAPFLRWAWVGLEQETKKEQAEIDEILIRNAVKSIDQVVQERGGIPPGIGRIFVAPREVLFEPDLVRYSKEGRGEKPAGDGGDGGGGDGTPGTDSGPGSNGGQAIDIDELVEEAAEDVEGRRQQQQGGKVKPHAKKAAGTADADNLLLADLAKWKRKALKDFRAGRRPRGFQSDVIPEAVSREITAKLAVADSLAAVKAAFDVEALAVQAREHTGQPGDAANLSEEKKDEIRAERPTGTAEKVFIARFLDLFMRSLAPPDSAEADDIFVEMEQKLGALLFELKQAAYLEGVNRQLGALGHAPVTAITDQAVLESLRGQARQAAAQVVATYRKELARKVDQLAKQGVTDSEKLMAEFQKWRDNYATWKAAQVAVTESNAPFNQGVFDFHRRNELEPECWVQPDYCVCQGCQDMVDNNPYTLEEAAQLPLPLHPNCWHEVVAKLATGDKRLPEREDLWLPGPGEEA